MPHRRFEGGREYLLRLEHGRDWREQIEELADEEGIDAAWFNGMGAATEATIWFYDQDTKEYLPKTFDEPFEVAMAVGNVSFLDGERFAHTHVLLTREDGSTVGTSTLRRRLRARSISVNWRDGSNANTTR